MSLLLLFISFIFSFIFYSFYNLEILGKIFSDSKYVYYDFNTYSISWNIFYESLLFLIIGGFFFLFFSSLFEKSKDKQHNPYLKKWLKDNFKNILYYIGFALFYTSIYMILKELDFNFFYIIFSINTIIILLYLIYNKLFILSDLLKINTSLFSTIYIFIFIKFFITEDTSFFLIDFINSIVILISFLINIYSEKVILKKKSDSFMLLHFFIYLFLFVSFYFNLLFDSVSFIFSIFSFIISFLLFNFIKKIDFFKNSIITLKIVGIFFSYISIVTWIYYLQNYDNYFLEIFILFIILYLSFFNFKIHKLYENYTSFFFFIISLYFSLFYIYYNYIYLNNFNDLYLVFYGFTICFVTILSTYFYRFRKIYDYYFIYFVWLIISLIATLYYYYVNNFDLFSLWIILLYDSIMIFLSYFKLKQVEN